MANGPQCRSKGYGKSVLAIYTPSRSMTVGNESDEKLSTLEVTPAGKRNLDHVLLSLLAIERSFNPREERGCYSGAIQQLNKAIFCGVRKLDEGSVKFALSSV